MSAPHRIVVLGGGIAGLAAAYKCSVLAAEQSRELQLTVLERETRAGGCIETLSRDGFVAELGPDSLTTEKPAAVALAKRLGLEDEIAPILPEYRGARILRGGRLLPIPEDFSFFTPTSIAGMVKSGLFSPTGVVRAAIEPLIPKRGTDDDESFASFVTRRFGHEVLDRLAQPLVGGIYSGDPRRLSMQATLPQLRQLEQKYGSMTRGMQALLRASKGGPPVQRLVALRDGLAALVKELEARLGESIRTGSEAVSVRRVVSPDRGAFWSVALEGGREIEADAVICALPANASARLLANCQPRLAELLGSIRYHSVATVTMAYDMRDIPALPRCTGFVVPHVEGRKIMATTFSSQKYANRAPEGFAILRCFLGGALQPAIAALEDGPMVATVKTELRELVGIDAPPAFSLVRRWPNSLPEYALGHVDLVASIEDEAEKMGGFSLAGSAYRGVGIADCVRTGEEAAVRAMQPQPSPTMGTELVSSPNRTG